MQSLIRACASLTLVLITNVFVFAMYEPAFAETPALPVAKSEDDSSPLALSKSLARAKVLKLHERKEWRRLLHYEPVFFDGFKSQADGLNFFVAANGKKNPEAELEATLRAFFSEQKRTLQGQKKALPAQEPLSLSVYCQFPARFEFLNRELGLEKDIPAALKGSCSEYENFLNRTRAKSLTLVFSSFYTSNPSSIYGHTFIRINKARRSENSERAELLDLGVNFAANQTTQNPVLYAAYGLTGKFPGHFAVLPYYYKVREYSDFESRDLWEYDLNLKDDEVKRVVDHIWELGTTHFDYFYMTENCSYHMLSLLEAGAPRLELIQALPKWVLPTDTVKAAFKSGIVGKTNFRPSLDTQFRTRVSYLNSGQRNLLKELTSGDTIKTALPLTVSPEVLDAYIDYVDLHFARPLLAKEASVSRAKQALLVQRSRLPIAERLNYSSLTLKSPHLGHGSSRASFALVEERKTATMDKALGSTELGFRFAFHDLLDPATGLPETSEIQFADLRIRYWGESRKVRLENFTLIGVANYSAFDAFHKMASWKLKFAAKRFNDRRCDNCIGGVVEGGYGYSFSPHPIILTYALAEANLETAPKFEQYKLVPRFGPTLGLRVRSITELALLIEAKTQTAIIHPSYTEKSVEARLRWAPYRWGLDLRSFWSTERRELSTGALLYF